METSKILALCVVVGLVLLINLLLFAGFRRQSIVKGLFGDIDLYRRAGARARNPWQDEDDHLKELSRLVEDFKKEEGTREPGDERP